MKVCLRGQRVRVRPFGRAEFLQAKDWQQHGGRNTEPPSMDGWREGGGNEQRLINIITLSIEAVVCSEAQLLHCPGNQHRHYGD